MSKRDDFVKKALSWVGTKEGSKGHAQLVADYNKACDKGRKADINTPWCALFVGAVAQETDNVLSGSFGVPVDCSCGKMIDKARAANIWVEDDTYTPSVGDIIIYAWNDPKPSKDNTTGHDHTGVITSVAANSNSFVVTEGNKSNAVGNRRVNVNAKNIRGFICPVFADEQLNPEPTPTPTPTPTPEPTPTGETYKVVKIKTNLRIRKEPTTSSAVVGRLANGDRVTIYDKKNGFGKVIDCPCYTDPTLRHKTTCPVGWVSMSYLQKV